MESREIAAAFMSVVPAERRERVEEALRVILAGIEAGEILNVDWKEAKLTLDRAAEAAYDAATDHFWHGKGGTLSQDREENAFLNDLVYKGVGYVRDAIAREKLLGKATIDHPFVREARRVVAAILPLALAMEDLRKHIAKGRRPPSAEVLAERAAKLASVERMERATCGCCFGEQAVLPDGRIHDHGYRKPRAWMKSRSCYGWGKKPLEVSDVGPRFMVSLLTGTEREWVEGIERLRRATKLSVERYEMRNGVRVPKFDDIEVGHPEFERVKQARIYEAEANLKGCRRDLATFREVVAEWKPGMKVKPL